MISDFQILGISPTDDISIIRGAYRKRVKESHPDVVKDNDSINNHLLFIQITKAYQRLISRCTKNGSEKPVVQSIEHDGKQLTRYKDPAYSFYREGMKYFMKIHPSEWKLESHRMLESTIPGNEKDRDIIKNKVKEIFKTFPNAYYYFSIVANEYPDSRWSIDSRDKMRIIEERTNMYKKIIDSFDKL